MTPVVLQCVCVCVRFGYVCVSVSQFLLILNWYYWYRVCESQRTTQATLVGVRVYILGYWY